MNDKNLTPSSELSYLYLIKFIF